ncbi:MAG: O-antigen ligase family protein [Casimicrobiaceae bacterium]
MIDDRGGEHQIADLVTLDEQDAHGGEHQSTLAPLARPEARRAFVLMDMNYNRWLASACAVYIAFAATNFGTFWRSSAFVAILLLVAGQAWRWRRGDGHPPPWPPATILVPVGCWFAWSALSWFWSIDPRYTRHELKGEILDNALLAGAFYIAAANFANLHKIAGGVLISLVALATAACAMALLPGGWNPNSMHAGSGSYSTFIVLAAPWLILALVPQPLGLANGHDGRIAALLFLPLLLASARLTDARMVWIALLGAMLAAIAGIAWRWPRLAQRARWPWYALFVGIAAVLGLAFFMAAHDRAEARYPPHTSVEQSLAGDPRLALWARVADKIEARPIAGYGFGRHILAGELVRELADPLLAHAHNLFVGQWLQTGIVGLVAFSLALAGMAWRFAGYLRAASDELAILGLLGLVILVGFLLKNVTDDFLFGNSAKALWCMTAALLGLGERLHARSIAPVLDPRPQPG